MLKKSFIKAVLASIVVVISPMQGAVLLTGDAQPPNSFTFPIQAHIGSSLLSSLFVGAAPGANPGIYAISAIGTMETKFTTLAPATIMLNEASVANPMFNQGIRFLSLFESTALFSDTSVQPIVVVDALPANIYMLDHITSRNLIALSAENIQDATGLATTNQIRGITTMLGGFIAAAVTPNGTAQFGGVGSGIALVALLNIKGSTQADQATKSVNKLVLMQLDAQAGAPVANAVRASAFDVTSSFLGVGGTPLASMTNVVDLFWDNNLQRLYVALQVTTGATGGRALVVGGFENGKLVFHQFMPDAAIDNGTGTQSQVVGTSVGGGKLSLQKVRTLLTSTYLTYVIVVGGSGAVGTTNQQVSALPVIASQDPTVNGTLAQKSSVPTNFFVPNPASSQAYNFSGRALTVPAATPPDAPRAGDLAVQVGGGAAPGNVNDIYAFDDTVFISTDNSLGVGGLWYSQAFFDQFGRIQGWTPWQRVAGTSINTFGFVPDLQTGNFTMFNGANAAAVTIAQHTQWGQGSADGLLGGTTASAGVGLVGVLGGQFPQSVAGIQGFFNFPFYGVAVPAGTTPGLANLALFIATGLNKVVLVQSGAGTPYVTPTAGDFATDMVTLTDGAITQNLPVGDTTPVVLSISGGFLDTLGPINAVEIALQPGAVNGGLLFVGGAGGLGVLVDSAGNGWLSTGLLPNFSGLTAGMSFVPVGSYSFVRKIITDGPLGGTPNPGGYLYVLTDTQLDRIDLTTSNFATGVVNKVTIATLAALGITPADTLLDFIVSENLLLIATSAGLFRSGNGVSISTVADAQAALWTQVAVSQSILPIERLFPVTTTGRDQDFARLGGSNVLILDSYIGKNRARAHRMTIADTSVNPVSATTVQPLPDYFVAGSDGSTGIPSYLVSFGEYKDLIKTDGAIYAHSRDTDLQNPAMLELLPQNITIGAAAGLRSGIRGIKVGSSAMIPLDIPTTASIVNLVRSSASGSWLAAGSFGLRVNE